MAGGARRGQPAAKSVRREPLAVRSWGEGQRDGRHEGAKSGDRAKMSFFQETADSSRGSTERLPRRAGKALVGAGEAGRRGDHVWLRQELRERERECTLDEYQWQPAYRRRGAVEALTDGWLGVGQVGASGPELVATGHGLGCRRLQTQRFVAFGTGHLDPALLVPGRIRRMVEGWPAM